MATVDVEPMNAVPIAHAGHWLAGLLYMLPVIVLLIGVARVKLRERREDRADAAREQRGERPPAV